MKTAYDLYQFCVGGMVAGSTMEFVLRWSSGAYCVLPFTDWRDIEDLMIQYGEDFEVVEVVQI